MNEVKDIISFGYGTGLNWDDDPALLPKGDGKYRKNVSLEEGGHHGVLTRSMGNTVSKTIIDPSLQLTSATSIVGSYTRYTRTIFNQYLFYGGTYNS
jgi:hypothetical protein